MIIQGVILFLTDMYVHLKIFMFPVTYPRGDIFRFVGGTGNANPNGVELFCHLNPWHRYFKKGYNSKDLFFEIKGKGRGQKIIMEKSTMESEILNDTSIRSTFYPNTFRVKTSNYHIVKKYEVE